MTEGKKNNHQTTKKAFLHYSTRSYATQCKQPGLKSLTKIFLRRIIWKIHWFNFKVLRKFSLPMLLPSTTMQLCNMEYVKKLAFILSFICTTRAEVIGGDTHTQNFVLQIRQVDFLPKTAIEQSAIDTRHSALTRKCQTVFNFAGGPCTQTCNR